MGLCGLICLLWEKFAQLKRILLYNRSMVDQKSAGHLSRVVWTGRDLQLQTEVRYQDESVLTTIVVESGVVRARAERPWNVSQDQVEEKNRIREYHNRLTRAIERLKNKQWISYDELPSLFDKMVNISLRLSSEDENEATDAFALIKGAYWAAVFDSEGKLSKTSNDSMDNNLAQNSIRMLKAVEKITTVLNAGMIKDMHLKTENGFLVAIPTDAKTYLASVSKENLKEARTMLRKVVDSEDAAKN